MEPKYCAGKDLAPQADLARSACAARSMPSQIKEDQMDSDLAALIQAWPHLPCAVRTGFMAMIDAVVANESPKSGIETRD